MFSKAPGFTNKLRKYKSNFKLNSNRLLGIKEIYSYFIYNKLGYIIRNYRSKNKVIRTQLNILVVNRNKTNNKQIVTNRINNLKLKEVNT